MSALEKKKPHYDLASIQATFVTVAALRMTKTSSDSALALGLTLEDVVSLVQGLTREVFYKSMTSYANSAIWQDVYHPVWNGIALYVKFTTDAEGFLLIQLKEK